MTRINKVEELTGGTMQPASANVKSGSYDPYKALASAIVEQAAKDLRKLVKKQRRADERLAMYQALLDVSERSGSSVEAGGKRLTLMTLRREVTKAKQHCQDVQRELRELEEFFWSDWFTLLSDLDGPALLEAIEAEFPVVNDD